MSKGIVSFHECIDSYTRSDIVNQMNFKRVVHQ